MHPTDMRTLDDIFVALSKSAFRTRMRLNARDRDYLENRGMTVVMTHARDFIDKRLAPAAPPNDGKQTPMRGHPVFVAQHATASCCRSCLEQWHGIKKGVPLNEKEKAHVLAALERWLHDA
jgi:hypothetical protein